VNWFRRFSAIGEKAMAMIEDADSLTWGRLVKSWATGLDYINSPPSRRPPDLPAPSATAPWTLPSLKPVKFDVEPGVRKTIPGVLYLSTAQLTGLMNAAGISTVNFPSGTTEVIIVQGDADTMVLRLPPKSVLQASEQNLLSGGAYPTPTFYEPLYTDPGEPVVHAKPPMLPDVAGIMNLHANRIGDYTMGLCA
jgi:hypothetical protein